MEFIILADKVIYIIKFFSSICGKIILTSPNSRAGFPYGAAEIFSLMQHMGCEPDRASYNILVDAYGRAGLQEGKIISLFCLFNLLIILFIVAKFASFDL